MQLGNKAPKRRVEAKLGEGRQVATRPNETWSMDFVHNPLATGQKLRVLTIVKIFLRFSPALDAPFSYRGVDVVKTLQQVCTATGTSTPIRVDQDSKSISRHLDLWAYANNVTLDFSRLAS